MQQSVSPLALVIPALDPTPALAALLRELLPRWTGPAVVVDDGSCAAARPVFADAGRLGAVVLYHGGNRGKGAALKTALRYCRAAWPGLAGCVTADADGQHTAADILRVADALRGAPGRLVLGCLLLAAAAGVCALTRCRMEEGLPAAVLGLMTAGYLLALAGGTALLGLLPWAAALAGGGLTLRRALAHRGVRWQALCQGAALFALFAALYWWLCRGRWLTDWDDFSHWGRAVKWMYSTGTLYTTPGCPDAFKSYPPATAVWQVMLLQAAGCGFREDLLLFANALLTAALLVLPFRCVRAARRLPGVGLTALLIALTPLLVYPSYFSRASVDGLLGVFCAALLLSAFVPGRSAATPWLEALGCFVLALVKASGAGLAVLAAAALFLARPGGRGQFSGRCARRAAARSLLPLGMAAAAWLSWRAHLALAGVAGRWQGGDLPRNLWSLIIGNIPPYRAEVLRQFGAVLLTQGNYGAAQSLPFAAWPLAFCLLMAAAGRLARRDVTPPLCAAAGRLRALPLAAAALGVTALFTASLLYSYLFVFDPLEAVILASVYRYLDSCTMLLAVIGAAALGLAACRAAPRRRAALLAAALAWAMMFPARYAVQAVAEAPVLAAESGQDRILSRRAADRIRALDGGSPRVWVVTANDAGAAQGRIEYDLLPDVLPEQATILMADVPEDAPWARQLSAAEWSRELAAGFDYVYIYCPEDQFIRDYLPVFEPDSQSMVAPDRMFAVVRRADGAARLRCVD
ncbi:MAG TPA: glycosyltransferase [Candidatus Gemmiger faecigallinarum]|nr:glycosyltransferase [Candidatus Gemmiger faecigallinarum]